MTGSKPTVLFVDDEERILRSLRMLFMAKYDVKITTDGNEALKILQNEKIHVLVSDQRMPIMMGVDLLRQARQVSPNTIRLLLTGYSDLAAITGSVNEGEIFRYINKPWKADELKSTVDQAVEIAIATAQASPALVPEKPDATGNVEILVIDDTKETHEIIREIQGNSRPVHWADNVETAFDILSNNSKIGIVVSEVRVGDEDITTPIKTLKRINPDVLTIVLTSFQDTKSLIDLINHGQIYRFLPKPIHRGLVEKSITAAIRHYFSLQNAPQLLMRHQVEKAPEESTSRISNKVMEYLNRIRGRARRTEVEAEA